MPMGDKSSEISIELSGAALNSELLRRRETYRESKNMTNGRRYKVACIVHSLRPGGAEIMACKLAVALKQHYDLYIVALDEGGPLCGILKQHGIPIVVVNRRKGLDIHTIKRLVKWLRSENISLVHAHQYTPFAYSLLARASGPFIPVIFTEHGRFFQDHRKIKRLFLNRLLLSSCDRLTAVCTSVAKALIENEGFAAERIIVIPNGVDTSAFFPVEDSEKREIRRKLDLKNDWFIIVMVARLDAIKDHKTALRAFEHVFSHCSQARLLLVGDGPLREELVQYTASRRLTGVVMFCGEQKNVLPYYQCADCFLLTSVSEGAPISVLEAMATGLPVVATHCGDLPSIVEHGATGYLAPVGDDALLAHYLLEIASNRESARRMGMAARLVCESKYSWASTVSRYAQLYKTTLREASNGLEYEHLSLFR